MTDAPMTVPATELLDDRLLDYRDPGYPTAGRCRARTFRNLDAHPGQDAYVVVFTELDDNPGPSITNAAEVVHAAMLAQLDPGTFVHIEHYKRTGGPDTFDRMWVIELPNNRRSRPAWIGLTDERLADYVGRDVSW